MVSPIVVAGIAQGLTRLFGRSKAKRAQQRAEEEARRRARHASGQSREEARQQYGKDMKFLSDEYTKAGKAVSLADSRRQGAVSAHKKAVDNHATAVAGVLKTTGDKNDKLKGDTLKAAARAARLERETVANDEASRFVRLREAAEAGGFNPLSVLQAGFLGSSLPTGFLSSDDHMSWGLNEASNNVAMAGTAVSAHGTTLGGHSTTAALSLDAATATEGARVNLAVNKVNHQQNNRSLSMQLQGQRYDQIMRGVETAIQAGGQAYGQTMDFYNGLASDIGTIGSGFQAARDEAFTREQFAHNQWVDRENINLQRAQLAMTSSALATGRQAGSGAVTVGTASGPTVSPTGGGVSTGLSIYDVPLVQSGQVPTLEQMEPILGSEVAEGVVAADTLASTPLPTPTFKDVLQWVGNDLTSGNDPLARGINAVREWWSVSPRLSEAPSWQNSQAAAIAAWPG